MSRCACEVLEPALGAVELASRSGKFHTDSRATITVMIPDKPDGASTLLAHLDGIPNSKAGLRRMERKATMSSTAHKGWRKCTEKVQAEASRGRPNSKGERDQ